MSNDTAPTLKCVVAWSERRNLCSLVGDALREFAAEEEIVAMGDGAHLVFTTELPETIRDRLRERLTDDEGLVVLEFEKWSGYGNAVNAEWLLRRGH